MIEVCAKCGSTPVYRVVPHVDDDGARAIDQVADHCSNPRCEYHDPGMTDYDWIVTRGV